MLSVFTYKLKNRVLLIAVPLLTVIFYLLAFSKTYDAIRFHNQLNQQISQTENLSYNPTYSADKLKRINAILNQYKVDTTAWREDFWMLTSGMASAKSIAVIYDQKKSAFKPEQSNPMVSDMEVRFVGKYLNLVQLIDSLERNKRVGNLSALEMTLMKEAFDNKEKKILVKANFKVISK